MTQAERRFSMSTYNDRFGSKVTFKDKKDLAPIYRDNEFCLLGYTDCAFSIIEWDKRGEYNCHFVSGDIEKDLNFLEVPVIEYLKLKQMELED